MPNWTYNSINIQGEPKDIREFMNVISEHSANPDDAPDVMYKLINCNPTPDIFKNIHSGSSTIDGIQYREWFVDEDGTNRPMMDITREDIEKEYGFVNSIDWQYANWGTKWGDVETELISEVYTEARGTLDFTFNSAWGEPFILLNDIATKYNLQIINKWSIEMDQGNGISHYPMKHTEADIVYKQHIEGLKAISKKVNEITNE